MYVKFEFDNKSLHCMGKNDRYWAKTICYYNTNKYIILIHLLIAIKVIYFNISLMVSWFMIIVVKFSFNLFVFILYKCNIYISEIFMKMYLFPNRLCIQLCIIKFIFIFWSQMFFIFFTYSLYACILYI